MRIREQSGRAIEVAVLAIIFMVYQPRNLERRVKFSYRVRKVLIEICLRCDFLANKRRS